MTTEAPDLAAALARATATFAALRADGHPADKAREFATREVLSDVLRARGDGNARAANLAITEHLAADYAAAVAEDGRKYHVARAAPQEMACHLSPERVRAARESVDALRAAGHVADADAALNALRSRVLLAIVHTGDLTNARGLALAAEGIL